MAKLLSGTRIYGNATVDTSITVGTNVAAANVVITDASRLGNVTSGVWNGSSISTTFTDAKITSVAGQTGAISNAQLASAITTSGVLTTANISEVTNLYFTNARAIASFTEGAGINIDANGLITSSITESNFNAFSSNIVPSADGVYDLGSPTYRWKTLYLANNTLDIGGATISSDGTGSIQISAAGAILPSGSKLNISNVEKEIATLSDGGTVQRVIPLFTQTSGLSVAANTFVFSTNPDRYVFTAFTLNTGAALVENNILQFTF
jgi:hypothetical protein